jgi:hypothetical protein
VCLSREDSQPRVPARHTKKFKKGRCGDYGVWQSILSEPLGDNRTLDGRKNSPIDTRAFLGIAKTESSARFTLPRCPASSLLLFLIFSLARSVASCSAAIPAGCSLCLRLRYSLTLVALLVLQSPFFHAFRARASS